MTTAAKEQLASPAEIRASLFEIPQTLLELLQEKAPSSWGPLTNQDDPDTELSADMVAKSVAENIHKQQQQQKSSFTTDPSQMMEPANVAELFLDGLNLTSLGKPPFPLSALTKLRKLVLSNNRLRGNNNSGATAGLDTGRTSVASKSTTNQTTTATTTSDLHLQRGALSLLPELRELQLDHNLFTTFPGISHAKLEILNVSSNDIKFFDPLSLPKLELLDVSGNIHLSLVTLTAKSKFTSLITLDVSRCELDSLQPLGAVTNLRNLDCHANKLTTLQGIEPLIHLEFLDASHNKLRHSRLQKKVVAATTNTGNPLSSCSATLQELHLQHNEISGLGFFPPGGLKNVWKLVLSDNPLGGRNVEDTNNNESSALVTANQQKMGNENDDDDIGDAEYDTDSNDGSKKKPTGKKAITNNSANNLSRKNSSSVVKFSSTRKCLETTSKFLILRI